MKQQTIIDSFARLLVGADGSKSELLNEHLNHSEKLMRQEIGARQITALVRQFKVAAKADPSLYHEFYQQVHPYWWLTRHWAPKQSAARTPIPRPTAPGAR